MAGKGIIVLNNGDIRDLVNGRFVKKEINGVTISVVWDTYFNELMGKVFGGIDVSNGSDMTGGIKE